MASYVLYLELDVPRTLRVGALGDVVFEKGGYLYVGSAKRNRDARIRRHLARTKKVRWHVDYLTVLGDVAIEQVWIADGVEECAAVQALLSVDGVSPAVRGFGSGDCRRRPAHLLRVSCGRALPCRVLDRLGYVAWKDKH